MDAASREVFRWKFYHLVIVLNVVIFAIAIAVVTAFLAPFPFRVIIPLAGVIVGALAGFYFHRKYHEVKIWLDENA